MVALGFALSLFQALAWIIAPVALAIAVWRLHRIASGAPLPASSPTAAP